MRWSGVNVFLIGDNQDQRTVMCSLSEAGSMRFCRENRVAGSGAEMSVEGSQDESRTMSKDE